jgi:LPS sulfotransferase NodH
MPTRATSIWNGQARPAPADLRGAEYDVTAGTPPEDKLLICAAPRSSSKRLARLLLGAGLGVPMEYFNETSVGALTARWQIHRRDYLSHVYARRTVNGVFVTNLQHRQLEAWPYPRDFDGLFAGAVVVHLIRRDKAAQAASLAACWLTGDWGFDEPSSTPEFSPREMKRAATKAMAIVAAEDQHLQRWFDRYGVDPIRISADDVNRSDLTVVAGLAARLEVEFDRAGAERMLQCDSGPYRGYDALKSRLREYLPT